MTFQTLDNTWTVVVGRSYELSASVWQYLNSVTIPTEVADIAKFAVLRSNRRANKSESTT